MRVTLRTASISVHWKNSCEKMEMLCFGFEGYVVFGFFKEIYHFLHLKDYSLGCYLLEKSKEFPESKVINFHRENTLKNEDLEMDYKV